MKQDGSGSKPSIGTSFKALVTRLQRLWLGKMRKVRLWGPRDLWSFRCTGALHYISRQETKATGTNRASRVHHEELFTAMIVRSLYAEITFCLHTLRPSKRITENGSERHLRLEIIIKLR